MILVSHPTGNPNVRGLLRALEERHLLEGFHTTLGFTETSILGRLPGLARRTYPVPGVKLHTLFLPELKRFVLGRLRPWRQQWGGQAGVDRVYRSLDDRVATDLRKMSQARRRQLSGVYAYEDGASETFRAARDLGLPCLYELPIGYWRAAREIFREEEALQPEWRALLPRQNDIEEKLARKDDELARADAVIVASSFTRRTLERYPGPLPQTLLIPYGASVGVSQPAQPDRKTSGGPLRVLYVGSLSQRKGISYLFDALRQTRAQCRLTVLGRKPAECEALTRELARHTWIPSLPHSEVLDLMRSQDVLVFPSLFEGFGLVILEALAAGLPVITTPHTAGPDLISEGVDGFIVPIRNAAAIAEKLELLAEDGPRLREMKHAAATKAATYSWARYGSRIGDAIPRIVGRHALNPPHPAGPKS